MGCDYLFPALILLQLLQPLVSLRLPPGNDVADTSLASNPLRTPSDGSSPLSPRSGLSQGLLDNHRRLIFFAFDKEVTDKESTLGRGLRPEREPLRGQGARSPNKGQSPIGCCW